MDVVKFAIPEIIFGRGSMKYTALCARRLGAEKVFLVSDPGLEKVGWVDELINILEAHQLEWVYFGDVVSNPRDYQIERGARLYLSERADVVIALGGGSPMDAAKGIAIVASNGGSIHDYEGANRIHRPLPPMVFLPTTAGSGSDISQFAIITDTRRRVKMSIISRTLVPNISIIDPLFLQTKPRELVLSSAIDALSHAIESFVSVIASPFTEMQSLKAIELVAKYLPTAAVSLELDTLEALSTASTAAAMAFSNAGLGAVHALSHAIGGMYDVLHGHVHPVLLPPVMRFNMEACLDKMAQIGRIISGRRRRSKKSTAIEGIETLREMFLSLNMKVRLRDILPDDHNIELLCRMAIQDVCVVTNPRPVTWKDLVKICEEAW
ncbi:iron-containing alcohol dehydrogenase [Thermodesulforhabdus norvegica]|uniref:Alcohol dehydrogenase n=1 Tax=Thermodesulforhabdus norvegica TaxID=39841 RepID=A0A1I4W9C0_9BACT|nr:iron-containing alcohol dehydrogenase [Thermodesulforhabdus norvegica]SFN10045.1 alcohol dehydrogenase [Thermodesulforhabdus norvegica]